MEYIPKLKPDIELVPFDTSNRGKTYILIHKDRRWQIAELLYLLITLIDGKRTIGEITAELRLRVPEEITSEDVDRIIDKMLKGKGLLDGTEAVETLNPKSGNRYLWLKIPFIRSSFVERFKFLTILFNKKLILVLTAISAVLQIYSYIGRITFNNYYEIMKMNSPKIISIILIINICAILHEFGHMSAYMKYGLKPGNIGFGIYLTMPVLYADVSGSWKLKRMERALVDVGGIYFGMIYCIFLCIIGLAAGNNIFIFGSFILFIYSIGNFNPFLKMDGYWVLSDLLGIPNLHKEVKEWISSKFYRTLKLNVSTNLQNYRTAEKRIFYIYSVFSVIYTISFAYGVVLLLIGVLNKLPELAVSLIETHGRFYSIITNIAENFGTILMLIILVRIIAVTIKRLLKFCRNSLDLLKGKHNFPNKNLNQAKVKGG